MTWKKLAEEISRWTEEQQGQDVTCRVQSMDEFGVATLEITGEEPDVLDPSSYYLDVDL